MAATPRETWGPISQGNLGLKAGYWTDEGKTALEFEPIVGWVTWHNDIQEHGFTAVVLSQKHHYPTFAPYARPLYAAVFPVEMTEDQAFEEFVRMFGAPKVKAEPDPKTLS